MKTQHLRLQQDVDYAESLRMDREKEQLIQARKDHERQEEALRKQEEQNRIKQLEEIERIRNLIASKLPAEPEKQSDTILVRIQMPSGQLSHRFNTSDSLKVSEILRPVP